MRYEVAVFAGDEVTTIALPKEGQVSVGRAAENDVRVDNPSVSRKHAVLHVGGQLVIEDLGGSNGTFVHDAEATEREKAGATQALRRLSAARATLQVGDFVNLGSAMLVIRRASASGERRRVAVDEPTTRPSSPEMQALYDEAERGARSLISVLILGETGVGKEVLARWIHRRSPRADGPFLGINCAALSEQLLESELFGHEKGAFTGASGARPGLFEAAEGGTVFLDEVGELPLQTQVKLLRVLEDRKVLRVGSRTPKTIDVRFVAATNRDLEGEAQKGRFREDLLYRLNALCLTVPPLRQRLVEISELAHGFVEAACRQIERDEVELAPETVERLERYAWPGNVRELRNVVERAVVLCTGDRLLPEHLPSKVTAGAGASDALGRSASSLEHGAVSPGDSGSVGPGSRQRVDEGPSSGVRADPSSSSGDLDSDDDMQRLRDRMREVERQRIIEALEKCGGNQTRAADVLGISRRTLVTRLDEYDIPRPRKKA